ncbi:MAG: hypothetical protein GY844_21330 [Bradyrhizobium sp.]|nr:hypothetical protein [Bradyrhizobium sp.]
MKYLNGNFWLDDGPPAYVLITVDGFPLGWARRSGGRLRSRERCAARRNPGRAHPRRPCDITGSNAGRWRATPTSNTCKRSDE